MTGQGAGLLAALHDADDRIKAVQDEWDTLPRVVPGGWILQEIRDNYYQRLHQAQADREAIASRTWGYFESGQPSALEHAAWMLMSPRWQHRRQQ